MRYRAALAGIVLTALITSTGLLFQAYVRTVMAGMGFQPALA